MLGAPQNKLPWFGVCVRMEVLSGEEVSAIAKDGGTSWPLRTRYALPPTRFSLDKTR